jgi:hypothetical protein
VTERGSVEGPDEGAGLESWLREVRGEPPRPAFRAACRTRFLAGDDGVSRSPPAVRSSTVVIDRDEQRLADVRITPPAAERFRAEVRRSFLAQEAVPEARSRPPAWKIVLVPLAAAAAILAIAYLLPDETRWKVVHLQGEGPVEVSSGRLAPGEPSEIRRLSEELTAGTRLSTAEQEVTLAIDDVVSVRVLPHSRIRFQELGELGEGRPLSFVLESGELYFRTHAGYPGDPIRVETSDVEVRASGTAFGVLVDERGTCTCVCDGVVTVRTRGEGGADERVDEGTSYLVFRGGAMGPKKMPFDTSPGAPEAEHIQELLDFTGERR